MTVARLRAEMPQAEYVRWRVFHGRRVQAEQRAAQKAKRRRR